MFVRGIKFRLISLFVLFFGSTLIIFSFFLYNYFENSQQTDFDASLYNYTVDIVNSVKLDFFGSAYLSPDFSRNADKIFPFSLGKTFVLFRTKDGNIIVRSKNSIPFQFPFNSVLNRQVFLYGKSFDTIYLDSDQEVRTPNVVYRLVSHKVDTPGGDYLIVQVAAPMDLLERQQKGIFNFFLFSIPVVLLLSSLMGLFFTRRVFNPVTDIIKKAQLISFGNLSERIPVPKIKDEIYMLVTSLNDLLDRLEKAFQSQERFVSDASHQLKTPLAIMKGELDLIKKKALSPEEQKTLVESLTEETEALSKIVENLLLLARVEAGIEKFNFTNIQVEDVILNQVARLEKVAKAKGIKIRFNISENDNGYKIRTEEELLGCLFHNLIENAIKYSPENTEIDVHLYGSDQDIVVSIKDQGPGIPIYEQDKIFDRFYRAENHKTKSPGYGLGLALARKIAQTLGGYITVHNNSQGQGAEFQFRIKNN